MSQSVVEYCGGPYDGRRIEEIGVVGRGDHMLYDIFRDKKVGQGAWVTSEFGMHCIDDRMKEAEQFETEEEFLTDMRKRPGLQRHRYQVEERIEDGDTVTIKVRYVPFPA